MGGFVEAINRSVGKTSGERAQLGKQGCCGK